MAWSKLLLVILEACVYVCHTLALGDMQDTTIGLSYNYL